MSLSNYFITFCYSQNALEVLYTYYACMMEIYTGVLLYLCSQIYIQWSHTGGLKLAAMGVFIPQKSANATKHGFTPCFVDCLNKCFSIFFCFIVITSPRSSSSIFVLTIPPTWIFKPQIYYCLCTLCISMLYIKSNIFLPFPKGQFLPPWFKSNEKC